MPLKLPNDNPYSYPNSQSKPLVMGARQEEPMARRHHGPDCSRKKPGRQGQLNRQAHVPRTARTYSKSILRMCWRKCKMVRALGSFVGLFLREPNTRHLYSSLAIFQRRKASGALCAQTLRASSLLTAQRRMEKPAMLWSLHE